jgi:hypothetical protein
MIGSTTLDCDSRRSKFGQVGDEGKDEFFLSMEEVERIAARVDYRPGCRHELLTSTDQFLDQRLLSSTIIDAALSFGTELGANYTEWICHRRPRRSGSAVPAIMLCVSEHAPVAAYSEIATRVEEGRIIGHDWLDLTCLNRVRSPELVQVEEELLAVLREFKIAVLCSEQLLSPLPEHVARTIDSLWGNTLVLHALFQASD